MTNKHISRIGDLRAYIDALSELGDIQTIDQEVDWNLEIGAIIRRSYDLKAAAPLFTRIRGIQPGFRVLGAPAGVAAQSGLYLARVALSLGLNPRRSGADIVEAIASAISRPGVKPVTVSTAPCKDVKIKGDDVNLEIFPIPVIHGGDGGWYINTFGINVVQTPDGSWTNWSINRMMVHNRNHLTGTFSFNQHIGMIHSMWKELGTPMPIAIALGVEPALPFLAGGMPLPARI